MSSALRPIGYFVHHHGSGHLRRCWAIVKRLKTDVVVFTAGSFAGCGEADALPPHVRVQTIPDFHAVGPATDALLSEPRSSGMDCAPLGVAELRQGMAAMARWIGEADPMLMVVDVSSEVALLCRLLSVPIVAIRLHGSRSDLPNRIANESCSAFIAPFDERLEQEDWPSVFRDRTRYLGGMAPPASRWSRSDARNHLRLGEHAHLIVSASGGGDIGNHAGSLSLLARARPDSMVWSVGNTFRGGHETDFSNFREVGWVEDLAPYIAAADLVVASAGDTLVHGIAQLGRPYICVPEWCYYDEQLCKAKALDAAGVATHSPSWPGTQQRWKETDRRGHLLQLGRAALSGGSGRGYLGGGISNGAGVAPLGLEGSFGYGPGARPPNEPSSVKGGVPKCNPAFFDALYAENDNPWKFRSSGYEQARFQRILDALSGRKFRSALELGCSNGELTARLARRCTHVVAVDSSTVALESARRRCTRFPWVDFRRVVLPEDEELGQFDLIVFSELGYYFDPTRLGIVARWLRGQWLAGGVLLACHWLGEWDGHSSSAAVVHETLAASFAPATAKRLACDDFILDVWERE